MATTESRGLVSPAKKQRRVQKDGGEVELPPAEIVHDELDMGAHRIARLIRLVIADGAKNRPVMAEHRIEASFVFVHMAEILFDADKKKIIEVTHQVDQHRVLGGEGHRHVKSGICFGADLAGVL